MSDDTLRTLGLSEDALTPATNANGETFTPLAAVMDVLCSTFPECDKKKFKRVYLSSTDIFTSDPLVANTLDLFF